MAKQKQTKTKPKKEEKVVKRAELPKEVERDELLIRIGGNDIGGSKNVYVGLTKIKGVGWAISNAICLKLGLSKTKKISELSKAEIEKIENFLKDAEIPDFLKNRRNDLDTGENHHVIGSNLDMKKDFDIRRLKKIRSYKGVRHIAKLPVRGQRTRSNFRKKGQAVRVRKKK